MTHKERAIMVTIGTFVILALLMMGGCTSVQHSSDSNFEYPVG